MLFLYELGGSYNWPYFKPKKNINKFQNFKIVQKTFCDHKPINLES